MITVNDHSLCEYCFYETRDVVCPNCGYDNRSHRNDPIALRIGSTLNRRYLIGGVIGKGGFGITYLAYDLKLDARVAVKEYYPMGLALRIPGSMTVSVSDHESEDTFRSGAEKFYNEARMVAKFNGNINIVSVYDFFYENDTVYFTMGYLSGETLKSYLKKHRITEGQAVRIMSDITNALMAVHSLNILHRDISPDNIMICDDGNVKLIDFGAARCVMAEQSQSLSVILKQGFAPLEQYQKKGKQGPWTDIYALGATVFHALTGQTLDDPMSRLEDDSELMDGDHGISEQLWSIIRKCIMLKIDDRYQDVFELKKDLNTLSIQPEPFSDIQPAEEITPPGSTAKAFDSVVNYAGENATQLLSGSGERFSGSGETMLLNNGPAGKNILIPILAGVAVLFVAALGVAVGVTMNNRLKARENQVVSIKPEDEGTDTGKETRTIENTGTTTETEEGLFTGSSDDTSDKKAEDDSEKKTVEDEPEDTKDNDTKEEEEENDLNTGNDNSEFGLDGSESPRYQAVIYDYEYGRYDSGIPMFNFLYPRFLYSEVNKEEGTAGNNEFINVLFTRSDGSLLEYYTIEYEGESVSYRTESLYRTEKQYLVESTDIIPPKISDGDGIFIITGRQKENYNNLVYLLMRITAGRYYEMRIVFPDYESTEDEDWKSFYAEYLYRSVGFTNSSKAPRTFEEYMDAK